MTNSHKYYYWSYFIIIFSGFIKLGIKERKEREKKQRREHIIEVCEKLFLKKDVESITVDEIARESELAKGTLYIYFKSKEEIFLNIIYKAISLLYDIYIDSVSKTDNPVHKMRSLGEGYIIFYEKYPKNYKLLIKAYGHKIMHASGISGTKEIGRKIFEKTNQIWNLSSDIIKEGINKGIFKEDTDPFEVSISMWAISTMFLGFMNNLTNLDSTFIKNSQMKKIDIKSLLMINGRRIIFSILKNPPLDAKPVE
jgi:TetR/AcrR family transcriptional regulator